MSTDKRWIGYHVSASGGYMAMAERAAALDADVFAFFTRNPRGGAALKVGEDDAARFRAWAAERSLGPLVAHAPYTLNPCSDKEKVREFAQLAFTEDLQRMELTPGCFYNFHPGSHVGQGTEAGITAIAELLNRVLFPEMRTVVLLETMAGKGSEVGGRFEELREILDLALAELGPEYGDKLGVCFDTCHVWDAGYDIRGDLDGVLRQFWDVIGPDRLLAVHLNDSRNPCASRKDRHEKLGEGLLGEEALRAVVRHPLLQGLPFILETPNEDEGYMREIARVREWMV